MSEASEAQKLFVGIPDCKLRRFTKPGHTYKGLIQ